MTTNEYYGRRILIVDDNPELHQDYCKTLAPPKASDALTDLESTIFGTKPAVSHTAESYQIDSAYQGKDALDMVRRAIAEDRPYALAFVDMRMPPGWDGLETIERLWEVDEQLQVIICTAYSDHSRDDIITRVGHAHRLVILKKPFDNAEVVQLAYAMTAKWRATREANLKMSDLEALVAHRTGELRDANDELHAKVDELEHTRSALETSEQRYALAAMAANDGLWDWDLTNDRVFYSPRWKSILGLAESDGDCEDADVWLSRVHPNDAHMLDEHIATHLEGKSEHLEFEHRVRRPDGQYLWVICRGLAVRDASGQPLRLAGSIADISHRKATEDQLRQGAYYDKLTGLPNRALLHECLEAALGDDVTPHGSRFVLLFLDFDNFKVINDSLGHLAGDELLIEIGLRLSQSIKDAYPASLGHTIARLGGDEFVVLLRGDAAAEHAHRVVEAIQTCFEAPVVVQGSEVFSTASIGITVDRGHYSSTSDALRDADTAMYHAKALGAGGFTFFDGAMRELAVARLRLENDLRSAIQQGEITLVYQPIIDMTTTRPVGVEALARWSHPELGDVSPERFISIAEETQLIAPLGEYILDVACRDLGKLRSLGDAWADCRINVNLSGRQFAHPSLVQNIMDTLRHYDLPPAALAIEVTETAMMEDLDASAATIRHLRDLGIDVYMDDFGTGYSSLSCLKRLPLTGLKLDRSFLAHYGSNITDPAIIHAIITLASNLKLRVVAEGVETAEQLAGMLALDCDLAQGFFFSKPLSLNSLVAYLGEHHDQQKLA